MKKKCSTLVLAALLACAPGSALATPVSPSTTKEARHAEQVCANINKLGCDEAARIAVKLRDKTKLTGYVGAINETSFTLIEANTGKAVVVPYPAVAQVKGHNLSTGAKIAIIGLGVAVVVLAFFLWLENAD